MIRSKWCDAVCIIVLCLAVAAAVLFMNGSAIGIQTVHDEDAEENSDNSVFTQNDLNGDWDTSSATAISLSDEDIRISGDGAYELNGDLVIAKSGTYVVSGELSDGSIIVDAEDNSKVWIQLNGVSLSAENDACFRVEQADKVFLTLAEGSDNTMVSGSEMSDEAIDEGVNGAIFARDDLTINGSGSLSVTAGYKYGIAAKDDLVITGGNISIEAATSAIHTKDSLRITGAELDLTAADDGLNAGGDVLIAGGDITIDAGDDGINAGDEILITGGNVTIDATDDGIHSDDDITVDAGTILINTCCEGIEGNNITVNDGDITIYPTDDGFNAVSDSAASGMSMGFGMGHGMGQHGGGQPAGGDTSMGQNDQTAESDQPEQPGDDQSMQPGQESGEQVTGGQEADEQESGEQIEDDETSQSIPAVTVNGGRITIINSTGRDADGIDSNGDIIINGGEVYVSLSGSGSNCALDYGSESGGECLINGGKVIACGGSSMIEEVSSNSAQASIMYIISNETADGTELSVTDDQGSKILSWEVPCGFTSVIVSSPEMKTGSTYHISAGDNEEDITVSDTAEKVEAGTENSAGMNAPGDDGAGPTAGTNAPGGGGPSAGTGDSANSSEEGSFPGGGAPAAPDNAPGTNGPGGGDPSAGTDDSAISSEEGSFPGDGAPAAPDNAPGTNAPDGAGPSSGMNAPGDDGAGPAAGANAPGGGHQHGMRPGNPAPSESSSEGEDPAQGNGNFDPAQGNGDFAPAQGNGDFAPAQGNGNFDQAQGNDNFDPAQGNGDSDPAQGNDNFDPGQQNADFSQAKAPESASAADSDADEEAQTAGSGVVLTQDMIVTTAISFAVLIAGIAFAGLYRKRKHQ